MRMMVRWSLVIGSAVVAVVVLTATGIVSKLVGAAMGVGIIVGYWIAFAITLRRGGPRAS